MNAMNLMKALGDIPEDLVKSCFDENTAEHNTKARCENIAIDTEEIMKKILGDDYIEPVKNYKANDISFDEETLLSEEDNVECASIVIDTEEFTTKTLSNAISNPKGIKKPFSVKYCDNCKWEVSRKYISLIQIGRYNAIFHGDHLYIDLQENYSDIVDTLMKIDVINDNQKLKEQLLRQYLQDMVDAPIIINEMKYKHILLLLGKYLQDLRPFLQDIDNTSIVIDELKHEQMLQLLRQYLQDIDNTPIIIDKFKHEQMLQLLRQCMMKMININIISRKQFRKVHRKVKDKQTRTKKA